MEQTKSHKLALRVLFVAIWTILTGTVPVSAQTRHARVAILTPSQSLAQVHEGLQEGLTRLGYRDGKDITYMVEETGGSSTDLAPRVAKLMAAKPDVLFAVSTVHAQTAKQASATVPIVFAWVGDPIRAGLIANYPNSKSNLTGVAAIGDSLTGKRLEILLEIAPKAKRLLVIVATAESVSVSSFQYLEETANKLGIRLVRQNATTEEELKKALRETPKASVDAIFHVPSTLVRANIDLLVKKAKADKIPLAIHEDALLERGALVSYGPNPRLVGLQTAALVDKVLKGAGPREIPIETPDRFFLAINRSTAKEIGLKVPRSILERADRVVD